MKKAELSPDATLADVLGSLSKPVDYVCGALNNLYKCKKACDNAKLRIGITGSGSKPYYRILYDAAAGEQVFDSFFDNHVSFSEEKRSVTGGDRNWSSASMTLDEVAILRGKLKG